MGLGGPEAENSCRLRPPLPLSGYNVTMPLAMDWTQQDCKVLKEVPIPLLY